MANFGEANTNELKHLARVLRDALARLYFGLENPDFNLALRSAPTANAGAKYYHWSIAALPRLMLVAETRTGERDDDKSDPAGAGGRNPARCGCAAGHPSLGKAGRSLIPTIATPRCHFSFAVSGWFRSDCLTRGLLSV